MSKWQPKKYISPSTNSGTEKPRKSSGKYAQAFGRGYELLLINKECCRSGEDHREFRKINHLLKNQSPLSIEQKKDLEMTPTLENEVPVVSTSCKPAP
ncbi:hypothetical protein O181_130373 [Austropuccinia psidii MF-1]|uniref:Uncharacterized protein n=1 Tax=Austropuccinia psidii MF-1 TaxID=1389203 RepID=A0A9Q3Q9R3_9BASI|nr:hypothetical protein [Austropuccinia psidii MF-1]